jgi:hypothetical protein
MIAKLNFKLSQWIANESFFDTRENLVQKVKLKNGKADEIFSDDLKNGYKA